MDLDFLLTAFVITASPGTGVIYTLVSGVSGGARAGVAAALGCTIGIVPHMIAALSGLAALLHTSATAFGILTWLGVAYLLHMAWAMAWSRGDMRLDGAQPAAGERAAGGRGVVVSAVLINLLNPKLSLFFLAFLPQFVAADDPHPVGRMLLLGLVFMGMTLAVFAGYGVCAARLRGVIAGNAGVQAWMRRGFAAAFAVLAVQLALSSR